MLPFNFVDLGIGAFLLAGILRGRKRGFSQEFPSLLKWLLLFIVCTALYRPLGDSIVKAGIFDVLSAYLLAYLGAALLLLVVFPSVQRRLTPKLAGSDVFGRGEYYLGMGSGLVRFSCMLMMALALLNARAFTPAEVKQERDFQEEAYGSFLFPNLHTLQTEVFDRSLAGSAIKKGAPFLLIAPTVPGQRDPDEEPPAASKTQSKPKG